MFTWIGRFTSDSGSESILKFVLDRNGLSGIIFFEQEDARTNKKKATKMPGFKELNIASKIALIGNDKSGK
jgi:hypothetical protein